MYESQYWQVMVDIYGHARDRLSCVMCKLYMGIDDRASKLLLFLSYVR